MKSSEPLLVGQQCYSLADYQMCCALRMNGLIGYRLEHGRLSKQELNSSIDVSTLTAEQVTFHHMKLFAAPNHLVPDPWVENCVYLVDINWSVQRVFVNKNGKLECGCKVFDIPEASEYKNISGRLNVSLTFASQRHAVFADGTGRLFLLDTGDREQNINQWKVVYSGQVLGKDTFFSVVDSTEHGDDVIEQSKISGSGDGKVSSSNTIECLLVSVKEVKGNGQSSHNATVLTWLTFVSGAGQTWNLWRTRQLEGSRPFDHVSLERGGRGVTVASTHPFAMKSDSIKEVLSSDISSDWEVLGKESGHPLYTWSQTDEIVSVQLTLPFGTLQEDVYMALGADHIDVGVKNSVAMLRGPLRGRINVSTSTWMVEGQKLDLSLMKEAALTWDAVVIGDNRGEMTVDEATINAVHERLAHLTSDKWNPDPDPHNKPFNTQQLEACDALDEEDCIYLTRVDGESHQISHQATVSHACLFNVRLDADQAPALCLRHDVDGFLWQPVPVQHAADGTKNCPWQHVGSLDAFGYVQASKTQRRFSDCAPNLSLAAIADCTRHVYLYRQHAPTLSPLRNRRTGREISSIAKQHVVSLDPPDSIIGLHVSNDHVFIATATRLYAVKVETETS